MSTVARAVVSGQCRDARECQVDVDERVHRAEALADAAEPEEGNRIR
jgi:hypothetical protein